MIVPTDRMSDPEFGVSRQYHWVPSPKMPYRCSTEQPTPQPAGQSVSVELRKYSLTAWYAGSPSLSTPGAANSGVVPVPGPVGGVVVVPLMVVFTVFFLPRTVTFTVAFAPANRLRTAADSDLVRQTGPLRLSG